MSTELIEREIADLKKRVAELEAEAKPRERKRRWMDAFGAMKDCDLMDEAVRLGREIREQANREGR